MSRNLLLLKEADTYDVVHRTQLRTLFLPEIPTSQVRKTVPPQEDPPVLALKPDAAPSDMPIAGPIASDEVKEESDAEESKRE
jgi:hypothetical protein